MVKNNILNKLISTMKIIYLFILVFTLISINSYSQQKGDNTIVVKNVGFVEMCNALLDAGYVIEKKDVDLQTVKTEFKEGAGKNKWMKLLLIARIKDSTAIITGHWYNSMFPGNKVLGKEFNIENSTDKIEYTIGNPKNCFKEMNVFALSFGKEVSYSKK